ncbi:MAG: T9SS type A sorting domain-containing protein [Bacteroidota bacterium]|nr:T9SS type A sorting domain-containing protein [Bacteroidota bacterium]
MKKTKVKSVLILCVIALISLKAYTQEDAFYNLCAADSTEWSIGMRSSVSPPWDVEETYFLKLSGYEVINSVTYHKLIQVDDFGGEYLQDFAYLRLDEDSVLYLRDTDGDEEMIFDYSLEVGDTVRYFDFSVHAGDIMYWDEIEIGLDSTLCVLQGVSYISINGEDKKVWQVTGGRWVQSIGSDTWMWDIYQTLVGYSTDLLCVFHDGVQLYQNPEFDFCTDTKEAFYNLYARSGTEWSIGMRSSESPPGSVEEIYYLKLWGPFYDNNEQKTYHRIMQLDGFGGEFIQDYAYLRMDNEDSVLYLRDTDGNEEKIFDYSLEVGDTVRYFDFSVHAGDIMYWEDDSILCELEDMSTMSLNEEDKTVWEVTGGRWVQSIGSDTWMWDIYQTLTGYSTNLLCVFLNDEELYHNPDFEYCDSTTNMNFIDKKIGIRVYPNPTNSDIIIEMNNPDFVGKSFTIYNSIGMEVKKGSLNANKNKINMTGVQKGIYFLKINNEVHKIVKK